MRRFFSIGAMLLILCMLFSCEPVVKDSLSTAPVEANATTTASITQVSGQPKRLSVRFSPVPNASDYQVIATEANLSSGSKLGLEDSSAKVTDSDFSGSSFTCILDNLVPGGTYDISIQAKNNANTDWVTVYKTERKVNDAAPAENEKPTYSISPNAAKTALNVKLDTAVGYKYLISLNHVNARAAAETSGIITGTGRTAEYSFKVAPEEEYSVEVSYAYITASDDSLMTGDAQSSASSEQSIDMSAYDSNIKLEYNDGTSSFDVSGLPDGTASVSIVSSDGSLASSPVAVSGNEISIPASDFLAGLDHGYFSVNATMDDASVKMSTTSVWCFVAPIISSSDNSALWQTYSVSWSVSPSIEATYKAEVREDSSNTNTIPADPSRKIETSVSSSGLSITGLNSRTKYIAEVEIRTSDNFTYNLELPFETKSFAGTYRWDNESYSGSGVKAFEVVVTDAPAESNFQYYAAVSENDPDNTTKTAFRMLPLIDTNEKITTKIEFSNPGKFTEENSAYEWNYKKWAIMDASINYWFPCSMKESGGSYSEVIGEDNINYKDYVRTYVTTNASALGGLVTTDATTITSWEFREINGGPEIIFHNEGTGLAGIGMFKNPNPMEGLGQWDFPMLPVTV